MTLDIPKGVRDFLPQEKILRQSVVSILQNVFELYGYNPLETPALELFETLSSKYAGGEEILKETYTLEDNGKRKLGLRYDLTVPFARVIGMNQEIKFPFKRYQIDKVWRDGPLKVGRYREFWQCDVDVAGTASLVAEAELLALTQTIFSQLGLDTTIYVNSRKVLDAMLEYAKVDSKLWTQAILTIDKLKKIGIAQVKKELALLQISQSSIDKIEELLLIKDEDILAKVKSILPNKTGVEELEQLFRYLKPLGVTTVKVDISLARGLSYYTGTFYEVYANNSAINSSLAAGGRYDSMVAKMAEKKEDIPAVGISFGLDVICEVLKAAGNKQLKKSVAKVFIIPIQTTEESLKVAATLRNAGIATDMDLAQKGVSKNMAYANSYQIPYALIIGEDELKEEKLTLRNMQDGTEKKLALVQIIKILQKE